MDSVYTTTITTEARRRGIGIRVLDPVTPIFELRHGRRRIRCYNALTDRVGAATFHLAQNKASANHFLRQHGFPVPDQELFQDLAQANRFLARHRSIVVKPCQQWGGRGVSVDVRTRADLQAALRRAKHFEDTIVLESCVRGVDQRLILVNGRYVAAIQRTPAAVVGDGRRTLRALILRQNWVERQVDPSHVIPLDAETQRNLRTLGMRLDTVPAAGRRIQVRLTSNYHTGGSVDIVTDAVDRGLVRTATRIARLFQLPMVGIDFLVDKPRRKHWVIEISPDMAISPPEGEEVARRFLDYLFPETRGRTGRRS